MEFKDSGLAGNDAFKFYCSLSPILLDCPWVVVHNTDVIWTCWKKTLSLSPDKGNKYVFYNVELGENTLRMILDF